MNLTIKASRHIGTIAVFSGVLLGVTGCNPGAGGPIGAASVSPAVPSQGAVTPGSSDPASTVPSSGPAAKTSAVPTVTPSRTVSPSPTTSSSGPSLPASLPSSSAGDLLDLQLSLPWATGETQTFSGGPHSGGGPRNAVDFAGGSGRALAAHDGVAHVSCGGASVKIDVGDGWQIEYFHMKGVTAGLDGTKVTRGQFIGNQSTELGTCSGAASGDHVHFGLWKNNQPYPIKNLVIGGYAVEEGTQDYDGCLRQLSTGQRRCQDSPTERRPKILNEGTVGRG